MSPRRVTPAGHWRHSLYKPDQAGKLKRSTMPVSAFSASRIVRFMHVLAGKAEVGGGGLGVPGCNASVGAVPAVGYLTAILGRVIFIG